MYYKQAQLLLGCGRLYWLSLPLKVIQSRWFLRHPKRYMPLPNSD